MSNKPLSWTDGEPSGMYMLMGLVTPGFLIPREITAFMPSTGGFVPYATKYVKPALDAAAGWDFCGPLWNSRLSLCNDKLRDSPCSMRPMLGDNSGGATA